MRVLTWNVNSIRKRLDHLCDLLSSRSVDVAMLQEIKCTTEQFPEDELKSMGYTCRILGQKSRNGVAIVSRLPIVGEGISNLFSDGEKLEFSNSIYSPEESRYLECVVRCEEGVDIRIASVYVPNGNEVKSGSFYYKLNFLEKLKLRLKEILKTEDLLVVGGDYNVAPENIDVYDSKLLDGKLCFHLEERAKLREILNTTAVVDAFRSYNGDEKRAFSWWNYREGAWNNDKGMRIDAILLSMRLADRITNSQILSNVRALDSPSDHAPVVCDIVTDDLTYRTYSNSPIVRCSPL
ncbi:exodeoxyribonuclease III [Anaplasma bovis]|uniref:exodeoxyribonuclease III n=1 Tax=Anaplasma bovis TaxID=186733 RepID=UPI002FF31416